MENKEFTLGSSILVRTPLKSYIYNDVISEYHEISDNLYANLVNNTQVSTTQEIEMLNNYGFFNVLSYDDFTYFSTHSNEMDIQDRKISKLILQITKNCNLRCAYCPYSQDGSKERTHNASKMSWDIAKKAVDFLFNHSVDSSTHVIEFYGGEPTLEFELIRKVVLYCLQRFKRNNIRFSIVTNATLLTDEMIQFFISYDFNLNISIDGIKSVNDENRKFHATNNSVFDTVIENLSSIWKTDNDYFKRKVSLMMVIDPEIPYAKYTQLFSDYEFISNVNVKPLIKNDFFMDKKNSYNHIHVSERNYYNFLSLISAENNFEFLNDLIICRDIIDKQKEIYSFSHSKNKYVKKLPGGQCIPGVAKTFVLTNGDILPCEKVVELHNNNVVGNVESGFCKDKSCAVLNCTKKLEKKCRDCFAFSDCNICVASINLYDNDELNELCDYYKSKYHEKIRMKIIFDEIKMNLYYKKLTSILDVNGMQE